MAEEVRDVDQRHIVVDEDAGEGVAEIVKADMAQTVLFQRIRERGRNIVWMNQIAKGIYAKVIQVFFVIRPSAQFPVMSLLLFHFEQPVADKWHQRQRTPAFLTLSPVLSNQVFFTFGFAGGDCMADTEYVICKIKRIPF